MSAPVEQVLQSPFPGERVELFDLDFSAIDASAPTLHLTSNQYKGTTVRRGGVPYVPTSIEGEGFDIGSDGKFPRPSLAVSNVAFLLTPWVLTGGDLIGAKVTRVVTLSRYLDGQPDEDATAEVRRDVYTIEQKNQSNPARIEFLLVAHFDQDGKKLPGRQAFADICLRRYRTWNGSSWDYPTQVYPYPCPYTGSSMWDINDQTTLVESEDRCSKTFKACRLRFPSPERLPTTAFPGLSPRR